MSEKKTTFFTTPPQAVEGNLLKVWGYPFAFVHLCFYLTSSAVSAIFKLLRVTLRLLNEQTLSWRDFKLKLYLQFGCSSATFAKNSTFYFVLENSENLKLCTCTTEIRDEKKNPHWAWCLARPEGSIIKLKWIICAPSGMWVLKYFLHFAKSLWVLGLSSKLVTEQ